MHFLRLFVLLFTLTTPMMPAPAYAQISAEEYQARVELAHAMANMTLSIITDPNTPAEQREGLLQRGFANVVDIEWIARFVLANNWRAATDEQKARYTELYGDYLTKIYVENYAQSGERKIRDIDVLAIHNSDVDDDHFTARTQLLLSDNSTLKVDYLVGARGEGTYKVLDVTIEGVSLLSTHRAEFTQLAALHGVDGVISRLEMLTRPATRVAMLGGSGRARN